jgi:hypothetical protein
MNVSLCAAVDVRTSGQSKKMTASGGLMPSSNVWACKQQPSFCVRQPGQTALRNERPSNVDQTFRSKRSLENNNSIQDVGASPRTCHVVEEGPRALYLVKGSRKAIDQEG